MRDTFGPRTYLVGQILAGLMANELATIAASEALIEKAIELADLTIHKMSQQIVHPWEKKDAAVPSAASNQNEAAL